MHYEELIREHVPAWPYPVHYAKENEVSCDVLILGGGIAGCWAAIGAARKGARVVLVEKAATKTSGAGGSGVDHWQGAVTNPACKVTPEEFAKAIIDSSDGRWCGISAYIKARESYDCLLELEKMGMKIRDSEDEFKGAEFRDEKTKLLFAYDYVNKYVVRVWGTNVKPALYKECKRLGVNIFDHIMVTSLLTKGGKQGATVVGAMGFNTRTGEFYIFKGKATVLCMAADMKFSLFSRELRGGTFGFPYGVADDGNAMTLRAGVEFTGFVATGGVMYGPRYSQLAQGNAANTWYACTIVDSNGKEIPWVDRDGKVLKTVSERYRPAPGQQFFLAGGGLGTMAGDIGMFPREGAKLWWGGASGAKLKKHQYDYKAPGLIPDWAERVRKGEFTLPFYADLPSMPEHERRAIFGLMVAQEGRSLIPVYRTYTQAGFDPDQDMLQNYELDWGGVGNEQRRQVPSSAGLVVDWNLKTNLDGLYTAGGSVFASGCHANAAATGRYAGRNAADYARKVGEPVVDRKQVDVEKARLYAPLQREDGVEWKELRLGLAKVMEDYCLGDGPENKELLTIGLKWLDELEASEAATAYARNPHELMRLLEVFNKITFARMIMKAYLTPQPRDRWITFRLDEGKVQVGELPLDYYGDLQENYETHCCL